VISRLPQASSSVEVEALLPWNLKQELGKGHEPSLKKRAEPSCGSNLNRPVVTSSEFRTRSAPRPATLEACRRLKRQVAVPKGYRRGRSERVDARGTSTKTDYVSPLVNPVRVAFKIGRIRRSPSFVNPDHTQCVAEMPTSSPRQRSSATDHAACRAEPDNRRSAQSRDIDTAIVGKFCALDSSIETWPVKEMLPSR